MESMVHIDGATQLFPTSIGYINPHTADAAIEFSEIEFGLAGHIVAGRQAAAACALFHGVLMLNSLAYNGEMLPIF